MTTRFQTVASRLVQPEWATRVVSPAYDALMPDQRAALMERDPYVFLHVTRSAEDHNDAAAALDQNAAALDRLLDAGVFGPVRAPAFYLYQLAIDGHVQTAIVADLLVDEGTAAVVLPHERTRPQRAAILADHLERVGSNSSPVALAYVPNPLLHALVLQVMQSDPILSFHREDRLQQTIWQVPDTLSLQLARAMDLETMYIVDGHHRMAAAQEHRRRTGEPTKLLVAAFPSDELRISAFHRRVNDLGSHPDVESFLAALGNADIEVEAAADAVEAPTGHGQFGMYVAGAWYRLTLTTESDDQLDVSLLQRRVLGPLLDVDEGADPRLQFLPGASGLDRLVTRTDGSGGVVFSLRPVPLSQLVSLVDGGRTLPPKSTYFEPKVRSGLFLAPR